MGFLRGRAAAEIDDVVVSIDELVGLAPDGRTVDARPPGNLPRGGSYGRSLDGIGGHAVTSSPSRPVSTISNRLLLLPFDRVPTTLIPPTSRVLATWVPPSACRSSPTISTVRISLIPSGSRLILVLIKSG